VPGRWTNEPSVPLASEHRPPDILSHSFKPEAVLHSSQHRSMELSGSRIGLVLTLSLALTDPLLAQTAGNTIPQSDDLPFATTGQNI